MNKLLVVLLFSVAFSPLYCSAQAYPKEVVRSRYMQALKRHGALDTLYRQLSAIRSPTPFEESYLGICTGMEAQFADGMWAKYKLAAKSKSHLNRAVDREPKDTELRFLRFTFEYYLPGFLLMSSHMNTDLKMVFANIGFLADAPDVKKVVLEFILSTHRCTPDETRIIERVLADVKKKLAPQSKT